MIPAAFPQKAVATKISIIGSSQLLFGQGVLAESGLFGQCLQILRYISMEYLANLLCFPVKGKDSLIGIAMAQLPYAVQSPEEPLSHHGA